MKAARLCTLMLSVAVLSSCAATPVMQLPPPGSYTDAEILFLKGDFENAYHKFTVFASRADRSPFISDANYWSGVCALKLGDVTNARRQFRNAYSRPRTKLLAGMAMAGLADCDFEEDRFSTAASRYRRALPKAASLRARMLYQLGLCYSRIGKQADSKRTFQKVTEDYPDSKYSDMSRERLGLGEGGFSIQVGAFGTRHNAEKLRSRLAEQGFSPHMKLSTKNDKVLYCVRVGKYGSWNEAQPTVRTLKAAGFDALTVP